MATSSGAVVAAMVARARREIRDYFERANAFDPAHAVPYDPPGRVHRLQFDALIGRAIVREAADGRYWIDREAERREQERRRAAAVLIMKIVIIGVALSIAAGAVLTAMH